MNLEAKIKAVKAKLASLPDDDIADIRLPDDFIDKVLQRMTQHELDEAEGLESGVLDAFIRRYGLDKVQHDT